MWQLCKSVVQAQLWGHICISEVQSVCFTYATVGYATHSGCFNRATFLGRWWRSASVHNQRARLVRANHTWRVSSLNHREPAPLLLRWLMRFISPSSRWRDQLCHHSVKQLERSLWLIWLLTPDVPHQRVSRQIHQKFTGVFSRTGSDGTSFFPSSSTFWTLVWYLTII